MHRFCLLNSVTGDQVRQWFRSELRSRHRLFMTTVGPGRPDLRFSALYDLPRIADAMGGDPRGILDNSAAHYYGEGTDYGMAMWAAPYVR